MYKSFMASLVIASMLFLNCGCQLENYPKNHTLYEYSHMKALQPDPQKGYFEDVFPPMEGVSYDAGRLSNAASFNRTELILPQYNKRYLSLYVYNRMSREVYLYIDDHQGPTVQPGKSGRMTVPIGAVPSYYRFCVNAKDGGEDLDIDFKIEQW